MDEEKRCNYIFSSLAVYIALHVHVDHYAPEQPLFIYKYIHVPFNMHRDRVHCTYPELAIEGGIGDSHQFSEQSPSNNMLKGGFLN